MRTYETSATVEDHGRVLVAGVPFERGTRVEVTITPIGNVATETSASEGGGVGRLLAALDKARNTEPVGPLRREELYDRKVLP